MLVDDLQYFYIQTTIFNVDIFDNIGNIHNIE